VDVENPSAGFVLQINPSASALNLATNTVERTFPYTPNLDCSTCTNLSATDLATIPGSPQ
jgi:hypothetical protein